MYIWIKFLFFFIYRHFMGMLKIRLKRVGRWKKPVYAVVVARKSASAKSGIIFEKIGFYSPASQPRFFFLNFSRTAFWLLRGVKITKTIKALLGRFAPIPRPVEL